MAIIADMNDRDCFPDFGRKLASEFPQAHWCQLAEIVEVEPFQSIRFVLGVKDRTGKRFRVAFYPEHGFPATFDLSQFKKGSTIAVFYGLQHYFLDGSLGIRVEDLSAVRV